MDRFDRIYQLHHLLAAAHQPVSRRRIEQELECSRATAKRIIDAMRLYLGAPILYDRSRNGYRYDPSAEAFELPGLWFNASELQALLLMQQLLHEVEPGLLDNQLAPIRGRIDSLLQQRHLSGEVGARIRLLSTAARPPGAHFTRLAEALLNDRRLHVRYHGRARDQYTERDISPQRLTRYRDNWYLEAWCHWRNAPRIFAIERIAILAAKDEPAKRLDSTELDQYFSGNYGIFTGPPTQTAVLAFSRDRARWIEGEHWHPDQQASWRDDGRYELRVPYSDPTELILDILRFGADVEVVAPPELRQAVYRRLSEALSQYGRDGLTE